MIWGDTRVVTHGAAEVLKTLLNNVLFHELAYMQERLDETLRHYDDVGEANVRRAMIDAHAYKVLLQEHRRIYVEQAPLRVRAMCANRSATT